MKVAIITLDNHLSSAIARVNRQFRESGKNIEISVHAAGDWGRDKEQLAACHQAIANANIIVVSMLFVEEHIQAVLEPLRERREHCDALVGCMCGGDIVRLTRLGKFEIGNADGPAKAFFKRLRKTSSRKKSANKGAMQMAMLRRIPKLLKYIPGTAQDIRNYFMVLQYWLAGSDENAANLVLMLANNYAAGPREQMRGLYKVEPPREYPDVGLYHPALLQASGHRMTDSLSTLRSAQPAQPVSKGTIGVILMRAYVLAGNTRHYDAVIKTLESRGYDVLPVFASGLDSRPAIETYFRANKKTAIDLMLSLTGFSLVGGPAYNDAHAAQEVLQELDVPYVAAHGIEFQTTESWFASNRGLLPIESAMMVAIPELDGAVIPTLYAGRREAIASNDASTSSGQQDMVDSECGENAAAAAKNGLDMQPVRERVDTLCARIDKLVALKTSSRDERRISIVIFNFPPNAGATGTAAYLSVFESVFNTLHKLHDEGYHVELPASVDDLRHSILKGNSADYGTDANVLASIDVDDHIAREPHLEEIESAWGAAPGKQLSNGRSLFVLGERFGNVIVTVQPGFGYEGDPMRLLFEQGFAPTHAFSAFYRYLREDFKAHAVLHFGTHGALEFMPGKQTGMSGECWPDRLIADLPNYYLYAANNSSEGTIAKRRAAATLISYLTPPVTKAGLYRGLVDLKSSINRWRSLPPSDSVAREQLVEVIAAQAEALDLCTPDSASEESVQKIRQDLEELEHTLIPHGLHIVGQTQTTEQRHDVLHAIADIERLPQQVQTVNDADAAVSAANEDAYVDQLIQQVVDGVDAKTLTESGDTRFETMIGRLCEMNSQLQKEPELDAIVTALDARYIAPVVGGDLLRTPEILPTGRNVHGFDPYRMPSISAIASGTAEAELLIKRHMDEGHEYPKSMAMVLWGTDNLKTEGSPIAQVLALIGARPRFDNYGRLAGAELIDLETHGRARIDVVVTLSGIFRDLLPLQTQLLAEAAWLAASAEGEPLEMNHVRKNALEYQQLHECDLETAALRVFSNADGAYGSNVNQMIDDGSWSDEDELADVFSRRKSFAYGREGLATQNTALFEKLLSKVELASQNLDSVEIGVTTVDHYFDTLGGISRSVQKARKSDKPPALYISDATCGEAKVRTLSEQVALETRTRVLNPKWYEQMLEHGYEGVRNIETHVTNTVGWSATTGQVAPWVYQQLTNTFMLDKQMRDRLAELNPEASVRVVNRLVEAYERNYWQPDEKTLAALRAAGEDLEDRLEGVVEGAYA